MTVLLGDTRSRSILSRLVQLRWGRMVVFRPPRPYPGEPWGFDNGAFTDWRQGRAFDGDAYRRRLDRAYAVGKPLLAVVPDIVMGGKRSLEFSLGWREQLPDDWPWYLAVQDGMTYQSVIGVLDRFDGLFLGGGDSFKLLARDWCELAHRHGKRFHYGRAGTLHKLDHAKRVQADSLDSAFPLWEKGRLETFIRHYRDGGPQLVLFREEDA